MKKYLRYLTLLAAAILPGVFSPLSAQGTTTGATSPGLLGQNYVGASYVWYHFKNSPIDAHGLALEANWRVRDSLDFTANYEWLKTDEFLGISAEMQTLMVGVRGFTHEGRARYYFDVAGGWAQAKAGGFSDDSSVYRLGLGAEISLTPSATLTPLCYYQAYTKNSGSGTFNYGLKGNVWLSSHWALSASILRNDTSDLSYGLGLNFRF